MNKRLELSRKIDNILEHNNTQNNIRDEILNLYEGRDERIKDSYLLKGHKCNKIAELKLAEGRKCWLGKLTEPLKDYPSEQFCLHIKTPLKEIVFGLHNSDAGWLACIAQMIHYDEKPINSNWIKLTIEAAKKTIRRLD